MVDKDKLKELSGLAGYRFNPERIARAKQAKPDQYLDGDTMLELEIFTRAQAIRDVIAEKSVELDEESGAPLEPTPEKVPDELRDEVKNKIGKLFGRNEESDPKNPLLKPQQAHFIQNFFSNQENWGMAFRTGIGKTRTFLEISSRWLEQFPQKMVLISTPVGNLVSQILAEIESFESLTHLSKMVVDDHDNLHYPMDENVAMLERLAIITSHQSEEEFRAKVKEFIGRLRKNIVIATPQKIEKMLTSGKIQPREVGLFILDEGGIGSSAKTGKYATYQIYDLLKRNKADFRVICADATPTELEYFSEKFSIQHWDFGDDPKFVNLHTNLLVHTVPSLKQKQMLLGFVDILENSYKLLMEALTEDVFEMCPELQNFRFKHADDTYPYISISNYEKLKKVFNQAKKHFQARDDYWKIDRAYAALVSFFKTQLIFQSLNNECYETAFDKIGKLVTNLLKKPEGFQARSIRRVLQIGNYDSVENSALYKYAVEARKEMEQHQILHHKLEALKNLLDNALKEGKKILVLCDHLGTANYLNYYARKKWGMASAVVHGSKSEKRKNQQRQAYVFNQFKKGDVSVIFGTSVTERGLDLPEIDYVVAYSPSQNVASEFQAMGRMRRGGTMLTLVGEGELPKFYLNASKRASFLRAREKYQLKEQFKGEAEEQKELMKSKFSGKPKSRFFVREIVEEFDQRMDKLVSERFFVHACFAPRLEVKTLRNSGRKLKHYTMRVVLEDKTGRINCYYSFDSKLKAEKKYEELRYAGPVIVNASARRSKESGDVYLTCKYSDVYYQEGIEKCPKEDADLENLRITEKSGVVSLPENRIRRILDQKPVEIKLPAKSTEAVSEKKRKKEPPKEQLGLFDQAFDDGADDYPRRKR